MKKLFSILLVLILGCATFAQAQENLLPNKGGGFYRVPTKNPPHVVVLLEEKEVEVPFGSLEGIDPKWIQHINILKDAAALEQYGEKGKYGVVLVHINTEFKEAFLQSLKEMHHPSKVEAAKADNIMINCGSCPSALPPLYLVKTRTGEVVLHQDQLAKLNPSWIYAIDVLKGKEAVEINKEAGESGVILITLKPDKQKEALKLMKTDN